MARAPARPRRAAEARRGGPRRAAAAAAAPGEPERLQKMLARAGLASRREAEAWIRAGRLTINGQPATLGARVSAFDKVRLDGRLVRGQRDLGGGRVFICHRSPGEPLRTPQLSLADLEAAAPRPGLLERLPHRAGRRFITISPMPQVDGGLELVTPDGALAERLQRRVHALTSEFGVRVRGELNESQLAAMLLASSTAANTCRCKAARRPVARRRTAGTRSARAARAASKCGSCSSARAPWSAASCAPI